MAPQVVCLSVPDYRLACSSVLRGVGATDEHADIVTGNLMRADRRGVASHGLANLAVYIRAVQEGALDPAATPEVVRIDGAVASIDGRRSFGQVAGALAVDLAASLAREHGMGAASVRHCGHVGHLGDYTRVLSKEGLVGIALANAAPLVAPFGGREPKLGTNPISITVPGSGGPDVAVDIATSATAASRLQQYLSANRDLPTGWAINGGGDDVVDPHALFKDASLPLEWGRNFVGALLPAAGNKGYALAIAIDLLAGGLSGGRASVGVEHGMNNLLVMALDPARFSSSREFGAFVEQLRDSIHSTCPRPGVSKVMLPGEPEAREEDRADREGVPVSAEALRSCWALAQELGVEWRLDLEETGLPDSGM